MAEQLQHVVLDQVAQRACGVVVVGARADADVLGGGDLHAVDVVAVPERLEHAVGESEGHHVLDGLLAQVVVDAEDLVLVEDREHAAVELARLLERCAERLLDDHAHLAVLVVGELGVAELLDDHGEEARRGGEVEGAIERLAGLLLKLVKDLAEFAVDRVIVEGARHVLDVFEQALEDGLVGLAPREATDRLLALRAVVLVGFFSARDAHEVEALGQRPVVGEVVERGSSLRRARSPVPPKITSVVGATGMRSRPRVSGFAGSSGGVGSPAATANLQRPLPRAEALPDGVVAALGALLTA